MTQESSGQRFGAVPPVTASPFLPTKTHRGRPSGADQLSQELMRMHGSLGEGTAATAMEEGQRWSLAHRPIMHLATGHMFVEYLLCATFHTRLT